MLIKTMKHLSYIKKLPPSQVHLFDMIATSPPPPPDPNKNIILMIIYLGLGYWIGKNSNMR